MVAWIILDLIAVLSAVVIACTFFPYAVLLALNRKKLDQDSDGSHKSDPFISVLIPVHNGVEIIKKKIENTLDSDYPRDKMEIVVVDDGSTDQTVDQISAYATQIKTVTTGSQKGKAQAITKGMSESKGKIVVMTDADVILPRDAIGKLVENFSDETVGFACGKLLVADSKESLGLTAEDSYRDAFDVLQRVESHVDSCIIINGALCAIRKDLFETVDFNVGEDTAMGMSVRRKGYRVVYEHRAKMYHDHTETLRKTYQQKKRRAFGNIQAMMKNKDMLFCKKYGNYGRILLPLKVSSYVICPFAFLLLFLSLLVILVLNLTVLAILPLAIILLVVSIGLVTKASIVRKFVLLFLYVFVLQAALLGANITYALHGKMEWG